MGCCGLVFSFTIKNVKLSRFYSLIVFALFSSLLASPALANIAEICNVPKKLTFSSIAHPKVKAQVQPLIKSVYQQLGIDVDFVVTASMRDLKLISNGKLKGAAVFSEDIIAELEGIERIEPAILTTSNMLVCRKGLPCSERDIAHYAAEKSIAVSTAMSEAFLKQYPEVKKEQLVITKEMKNVLNMIKYQRLDYGIYPISDHTKGGLSELPKYVDSEFLYQVASYHIIHSGLSCIQPMVEQVLADRLLAQK